MLRYLIPLGIFLLLILAFLYGLKHDPGKIPSVLIDKPLPEFSLQDLNDENILITGTGLPAKPFLLNVWASWCAACLVEHPLLVALSENTDIEIIGINYKDTREEAFKWLRNHGNPYQRSMFDQQGLFGIDLGVYGVPETFVVDGHGVIRYKHIGPITEESLLDTILPLLESLNDEQNKNS